MVRCLNVYRTIKSTSTETSGNDTEIPPAISWKLSGPDLALFTDLGTNGSRMDVMDFRHLNRAAVLYADGHAGALLATQVRYEAMTATDDR